MINLISPANRYIFLTSLYVFFLPFFQAGAVIVFVVTLLLALYDGFFLKNIPGVLRSSMAWPLVAFYLLHVGGMLYSENLGYGFMDLQTKLSFLLMPLVFLSIPTERMDISKIKIFFVAGCITACLICLVAAGIRFFKTNSAEEFFYVHYSILLHVTYFTIYLNLVILFLADDLLENFAKGQRRGAVIPLLLIVFLFINAVLLSGRTAFVTLAVSSFLYFLIRAGQLKITRKSLPLLLMLSGACIALTYFLLSSQTRFREIKNVVNIDLNSIKPAPAGTRLAVPDSGYNNMTIRFELWKSALDVIEDNILLGVGTGDIKEVLVKEYEKKNFQPGIAHRFSPHNQFLHTMVILGIPGLFLLLAVFISALLNGFREKNMLLIFFLVIVLLNCLTESVLERQAGIIFFTFFYLIFQRKEITEAN